MHWQNKYEGLVHAINFPKCCGQVKRVKILGSLNILLGARKRE